MATNSPSPRTAKRLLGIPPTIFSEMSALAVRTGALNLGQGFPDVDGPGSVVEAAVDALRSGRNQYAPGIGVPGAVRSRVKPRPRYRDRRHRGESGLGQTICRQWQHRVAPAGLIFSGSERSPRKRTAPAPPPSLGRGRVRFGPLGQRANGGGRA